MTRTALVRRSGQTLQKKIAADRVIDRLREAEHALQQATRIDQVKLVLDAASAQKVFATRQQLGDEVIGYAHMIRTRALGRLGELLRDLVKAKGGAEPGVGRRGKNALPNGKGIVTPTLADIGVDYKTSMVAQVLATLPADTREAIARREDTIAKARRRKKAADIQRQVSLPTAKYRVLYADPPWAYNDKADEGSVQAGGAARHYPSMSIAQLCDLPVDTWTEPNAVLFLWVTSPLLFDAAPIIKAWGFAYRASFVWDKVKHNMGHYNSVRHEFLLLCTRGSCTPDRVELFDSVQSIERTTHSTKPAAFRTIIDTIYPVGKRLELFARGPAAKGWDVWGNQADTAPMTMTGTTTCN